MTMHELRTCHGPPASGLAVTIYGRTRGVALALHRDPEHEALRALCARLRAQRFAVITSLPVASLPGWAAHDTPGVALRMAKAILAEKESKDPTPHSAVAGDDHSAGGLYVVHTR